MKGEFHIEFAHVSAWLRRNGIRWKDVERGAPVWPTEVDGVKSLEKLDPPTIEWLIAEEDPAIWAFLNLIAPMDVPGFCTSGDPLRLLPIQAVLARLEGNVIAECAAEVGKTQDIGVRLLHRMDTATRGDACLVVGNTEKTAKAIWRYVMLELEANPRIGGGVTKIDKRELGIEFRSGTRFETRLVGDDGEALRSGHYNGIIFADEVAKYKGKEGPRIWSELWRCAMPGARFRLYTTPDGDYSSPYFALSSRAKAINGKNAEDFDDLSAPPDKFAHVRFKKIWISKRHLGPPFFVEERKIQWAEMYGPEHSVGWLNNVEGLWGTPASSLFPMYMLEPLLSNLPDYRVVVAAIDREKQAVKLSAAELVEKGESILTNTSESFDVKSKAVALARQIASFFPPAVASWVKPRLFCGGDLGSEQDPSEYLWVHARGEKWIDVFRLHLEFASYPEQCQILMALDHASGHVTEYAFDAGNAGTSVAMDLQQLEEYRYCPICRLADREVPLHFDERILPFNFGSNTDEIDERTGQPILDPDNRDASGAMLPYRRSNKEFSTRIIERKIAAGTLALARDAGAGNPQLAGPQMMTNHTQLGEKSKKGERRFREKDDHAVDARRQVALLIVSKLRKTGFVQPEPSAVLRVGDARPLVSMGGAFGGEDSVNSIFGGSSNRRPFAGGDW